MFFRANFIVCASGTAANRACRIHRAKLHEARIADSDARRREIIYVRWRSRTQQIKSVSIRLIRSVRILYLVLFLCFSSVSAGQSFSFLSGVD